MSRTLRFKILWVFVALVAMLTALIAATPYLINSQVVKNQISRQISDWMGLPVRVRGEPIVTVFPYITFKLKNVQVASKLGLDEPDLVSMEVLRAEMYWLPMLLGKFEVRRFHLDNPKFELVRDMQGNTSWDMTNGSLVSSDPNDGRLKLSDISLGRFAITNGSARIRDEKTGWDERLSNINLTFDWPNTGDAASLNGGVVWRDQPVDYEVRSGNPLDLFGGGLSPVAFDVKSPMFEASLDGSAATMAQFQLEGDFAFATPSLRLMLDWLGYPLPLGDGFGPTALTARSNLVGASVSFSDMSLKLDDHSADGVLQLDFRRERPLVQGTLASDQLNLSPYLRTFNQDVSLLDVSVSAEDLLRADLDVRLSTDNLVIEPIRLGRTAASLVTRNSQLAFSVGETYAYGGRLEASLDMYPSKTDASKMSGHLRAKANGLLAGTFARELVQTEFVSGTTLAELNVKGEGMSLREMFKAADGDMTFVVTDGGFERFNLDILQDTLMDEDTAQTDKVPEGLYEGGTKFDVLSVRAAVSGDALSIEEFRLTSGKRALRGSARVGLSDMTIDFPASLLLYESPDPATHVTDESAEIYPFSLTGALVKPVLSRGVTSEQPAPTPETAPPAVDPEVGSRVEATQPDPDMKPKAEVETPAKSEPAADEKALDRKQPVAKEAAPSATEKLTDAISDAVNQLFEQDGGDTSDALKPKSDF